MAAMEPDPLTAEVTRLIGLLEAQYGAQARFAKRVGLTTSAIYAWKTGKTQPEPERWPTIEDYFGLPVGYLERVASGIVPAGSADPTRIDDIALVAPVATTEPTTADLDRKLDRLLELVEGLAGVRKGRRRPDPPRDPTPAEMPRPALAPRRR